MKQTLNYVISKDDCILSPEDCGLVNGLITVNGWTDDLAAIRGLYAPPYFSDNFRLQIRFNGRSVPAYGYTWAPEKLTRHGDKREPLDDGGATSWSYHSELFLAANRRAAILKVRGGNMLQKLGIPMKVQLEVTGGVRKLPHWEFSRPSGAGIADKRWRDSVFSLVTDDGAISVGCSLPMTPLGPLCSGVLEEEAPIMRRQLEFFVAVAVGANQDESDAIAREILMNPEDTIDASQRLWEERVKRLRKAMPEFRCDDREWERLYDQSLLHLLLNEWDVPEFKLHPSYSTGSVNGGCVCNYLWNYGRPFRLWSMLNPQSAKAHIRAFLSLDLTSCYAFHLDDATPFGPYYPVNQEKIVFLIHAYVLQTGDVAFLQETLGGKSILEHAMEQALMHDDLSKDAVLVDYGDGNHHLELRRTLRYDGIVPDLNLRRCITYHLVDELCKLAGVTPKVDFAKRAEALKALVKARLFDAEHGWFKAIDPDGKPYFRYTMQLFKALGWNDWAVDKEEEEALLRHLMNPEEFRGEFGLHSLSKQDPAYDENDVDHGGPGA